MDENITLKEEEINFSSKSISDNYKKIELNEFENISLEDFLKNNFVISRKYSKSTKYLGQRFFKYRFLKLQTNNQKTSDNDFKIKVDLRRLKSKFILAIEKSIFNFNLKKYKESYEILLNEKIIKNINEFGEILLVISGYDKDILTEFLSQDIEPNNSKAVLKRFLNCINMDLNFSPFEECLSFLLSNLNFPEKVIIEEYSIQYFNINKENQKFFDNYKSYDDLFLLISNTVLINNAFIGKDTNKNNKIIKRDQFIKMNIGIPQNISQDIFKKFQYNPVLISEDSNEKMYKKFRYLVKEIDYNEILKSDNSELIDNVDFYYENIFPGENKKLKRNNSFSFRYNILNLDQNDKEILSKPKIFTKYTRSKIFNNQRMFVVKDNLTNLVCAKSIVGDRIKGDLRECKIDEIISVNISYGNSEIISNLSKNKDAEDENIYIFIKTKNGYSLEYKSEDIIDSLKWFKAFKTLCNISQKKRIKKREQRKELKVNKIENKLEGIWRIYILSKWKIYGSYILHKIQNRINYSNDLNNKKEKIIKSDILNDKIIFNYSNILDFLDEIKNKLNVNNDKIFLDYCEFLYLYKIGIPRSCRNIIWDTLIGNVCGITKRVYNLFYDKVEDLNFEPLVEKYNKGDMNIINDPFVNQMIIDIINTKDYFINELYIYKFNEFKSLNQIYKLTRIFYMIRDDVKYNRSVINFAFVFTFVFNDEYTSFKNLYNLICSSNIIKFMAKDEDEIQKNTNFFIELIKENYSCIYNHFKNIDLSHDLYFVSWFENLFTKTLNFRILVRIFDLFLLYGEEVIFKIGLNILSIQKEDLLSLTISEIMKVLNRLPYKYDEELFFENLFYINIHDKFNNWAAKKNLEEQALLFQSVDTKII